MVSSMNAFTLMCSSLLLAASERTQRHRPFPLAPTHLRRHDHSDSNDSLPTPGLQVASHVSSGIPVGGRHLSNGVLLNVTPHNKDIPFASFATGKPMANQSHIGMFNGMIVPKSTRVPTGIHKRGSLHDALNGDILAAPGEPMPVLMALGGGTGASIGGTGSAMVDRDLLRRMHYQDKAVMLLVLLVYMVALGFSANLTYRQASNNFPVTYYADPRFHNLVMDGHDLDVFLDTFNQSPKNIALQVAGFVPVPEEMNGSVRWRGENFQVAFTFSLDLSPWVVRETETVTNGPSTFQQTRTLHDGVLPEDRSKLHYYLTNNQNDLAYVDVAKKVSWPGWEELATNIKHQIRQSGFTGVISVDRNESDDLQVYKNKPWANFMHARATRVLGALSIVGWLIYVPYMWLRCTKMTFHSYFKVDVSISDYWPLIADKLTADGFQDNTPAPAVNGRTPLPQSAAGDLPPEMHR